MKPRTTCVLCGDHHLHRERERLEYRRKRDASRVPLTDQEKVDIADWLYETRILEKFATHWEWGAPAIICTGPSLDGIMDMVRDAQSEET